MPTTVRQDPAPELVAAARDGDPRALDALVSASLPLVYNLVGRALRGHADVDDVVQETMLRVVRKIGELQQPESYRSWLVAIALRQARDQGKRQTASTARATMYDQAREHADLGSDFAGVTVLRLRLTEQRRDVAEATRWLDPEDRELLSLWWLEESGHLDRHELATALGLSAPHAAVRVHRMKQQLDTARGVVQALRDLGRCPALRSAAEDWDGTPSALWRKRFARHIRNCSVCSPRDRALVPVARLLRGLPLVPVPAALRTAAVHLTGAAAGAGLGAAPSHTEVLSAVPHGGGGRGAARASHASRRAVRGTGPKALAASHPLMVAGVAVAAAAVAAYAVVPTSHPATTASADAVQTTAAVVRTKPSPITLPPTTHRPPSPSPDPSVSKSAKPSPSKHTSSAAVVVPATTAAQSSSRKGISAWTFSGQDQALAESGASWFYTWSSTADGISAPGAGFVPMIWGSGSVTSSALAQAKQTTSCGCLLGFNEPDNGGQSNMTPAQALALWPQLMATGLQLGAPAVASGGADSGGWLDQFMTGAGQDGYRVNFIPLHWYGSDFDPSAAVGQLQSYIEAVYDKYHLPIWLTEFALMSFANGGQQYPSESVQASFLTQATKMLDSLPYVQRYAWFALPATSGLPSSGLFQPGPVLTQVGTAFEAAR
jgi:RNA polymerase sigma factor (sigma-70 family)